MIVVCGLACLTNPRAQMTPSVPGGRSCSSPPNPVEEGCGEWRALFNSFSTPERCSAVHALHPAPGFSSGGDEVGLPKGYDYAVEGAAVGVVRALFEAHPVGILVIGIHVRERLRCRRLI